MVHAIGCPCSPSSSVLVQVGQIFIKFMLCNFMLSALYVADPLCVHGGTFEADNTLLYDADDDKLRRLCAEVNTMLRLRSVGGLVLWALLTAFTLGDIVYAVSVSSSSSWDWNASAIIVVAIAGVMLLSVLLYPVRSRVWACTKACCRCTGRACGRCCVWAFCCRKASPPTA